MCLLITFLLCSITIISAQNRIIGGTNVSAGTYPWFAHAISGNCGGILIAANWVLTAAHCPAPSSYTIGALDYSDASNGGQFFQVISVSQTFQHPLYQDPKYPQDSFDFRLNKLDRSSSITPVDIDSDNLSDAYLSGKILKAIGFGNTNVEDPNYPNRLQHVDVSYMTNDDCKNQNYPSYWISDSMMCAGSAGYDACQGDSGGPLLDVSSTKVVGIVSWGISCAVDGNPGVYARISNQFQWIKAIICDSNQTSNRPTWCIEPTDSPSENPSPRISSVPSISLHPTMNPTHGPSWEPSTRPTVTSSHSPSNFPSASQTEVPSQMPSKSSFPSNVPTLSIFPSVVPSSHPSMVPSSSITPSSHPTTSPSNVPSLQPSTTPSNVPSLQPSMKPSLKPSDSPTSVPSIHPSIYYKAVTDTFLEINLPTSCPFNQTQRSDLDQALVESITNLLHAPGTVSIITISYENDINCVPNERHGRFLEEEGLTFIISIQSISRNSLYHPLSEQDIMLAIQSDVNSNDSTILSQVSDILDRPVETVMVRVLDSPSSSPSSIPSTSSSSITSMSPTTNNASKPKMMRLPIMLSIAWIAIFII
jgi:V8-like Glu-specific endopeptidase